MVENGVAAIDRRASQQLRAVCSAAQGSSWRPPSRPSLALLRLSGLCNLAVGQAFSLMRVEWLARATDPVPERERRGAAKRTYHSQRPEFAGVASPLSMP